jgi:hypothetical protein
MQGLHSSYLSNPGFMPMGRSQANSHLELCSGHLRVGGNTTPTNSTKTTMTNQRISMPFQTFANGIPLALVNVYFGCKLRFGVEAMPMTFRIERPVTGGECHE